MPKYVTLEWDEYQALLDKAADEQRKPKESVIQGYTDVTIMRAVFRKLSPHGLPVTLTSADFPPSSPEEIVRVHNPDGTISVFIRPVAMSPDERRSPFGFPYGTLEFDPEKARQILPDIAPPRDKSR